MSEGRRARVASACLPEVAAARFSLRHPALSSPLPRLGRPFRRCHNGSPFHRGTGRGSNRRRSIVLSGFHTASKRPCKQTARLASATRFQRAYCTKRNVDRSALGRMLISDESTSLGIPGMQTRIHVLPSFNFPPCILRLVNETFNFFPREGNVRRDS